MPGTHTPRPNLVSLGDAATEVRVSERTLRRWVATGRLAGYRVGPRLVRVELDEVYKLVRPITTADRAS